MSKKAASSLAKSLRDACKSERVNLSLGRSYEVISRMMGYTDWNDMSKVVADMSFNGLFADAEVRVSQLHRYLNHWFEEDISHDSCKNIIIRWMSNI